jgi:hypothetical protein
MSIARVIVSRVFSGLVAPPALHHGVSPVRHKRVVRKTGSSTRNREHVEPRMDGARRRALRSDVEALVL